MLDVCRTSWFHFSLILAWIFRTKVDFGRLRTGHHFTWHGIWYNFHQSFIWLVFDVIVNSHFKSFDPLCPFSTASFHLSSVKYFPNMLSFQATKINVEVVQRLGHARNSIHNKFENVIISIDFHKFASRIQIDHAGYTSLCFTIGSWMIVISSSRHIYFTL